MQTPITKKEFAHDDTRTTIKNGTLNANEVAVGPQASQVRIKTEQCV